MLGENENPFYEEEELDDKPNEIPLEDVLIQWAARIFYSDMRGQNGNGKAAEGTDFERGAAIYLADYVASGSEAPISTEMVEKASGGYVGELFFRAFARRD